jgi:hypothetical protein
VGLADGSAANDAVAEKHISTIRLGMCLSNVTNLHFP